ncbi:MAG: hypothetical protein WC635_13035 [Bacteriovorax sp.]|jgi:hypothetical protein
MKILLALVLSLGAITAQASEKAATAPEKLTSYLPVGYYSGHNDQGKSCDVFVTEVNYPKKDIQVTVAVGPTLDLAKLVEEGSEFSYKDHKKEFVQTERNLIGSDVYNYVERILRTTIVDNHKLYVVVSYSTVINRSRDTQTAECIIDVY